MGHILQARIVIFTWQSISVRCLMDYMFLTAPNMVDLKVMMVSDIDIYIIISIHRLK